jgi:CHAT domain-containing protein
MKLRQFQDNLQGEEAVIGYVLSKEHAWICFISDDTVVFHQNSFGYDSLLATLGRLGHLVDPTESQAIVLPPVMEQADLVVCSQLHDGFLGSLRQSLEGRSRLFIVPPAGFPVVPFDLMALPAADSRFGRDQRGHKFLAEAFEICYLPRFSALLEARRERRDVNYRWIGVGNSESHLTYGLREDPEHALLRKELDGRSYTRLPAIEEEIEGIIAGFAGDGTAIIGREATRSRVLSLAGTASVVHLASHGHLDERLPWRSGFLMSSEENGGRPSVLSAVDLFEYQLADRLLVLSGCRSLKAGGIWTNRMGLRLPSGGRITVIGSWSIVEDRGTADLMRRFYTHLRNGACSSAALALAKRDIIAETGGLSPNWASFAHVGLPVKPFKVNRQAETGGCGWELGVALILGTGLTLICTVLVLRSRSKGIASVVAFRDGSLQVREKRGLGRNSQQRL